jgi:aryl-alcohol dehydrogenase-like predicted oxidoreductase
MTFGSNFLNIGTVGQSGADELVSRAAEAGVNFFDTANVYSYGESEEILGQALENAGVPRESAIIATKVQGPMSDAASSGEGDVNNKGLSRQNIMASCEASLERLGTDYIDLYQVHGWDPTTPMEETLRTLDDLVRMGKVNYIGVSNWTTRHIAKSLEISRARDWEAFSSLQAHYSLVGRDLEHELLPLSQEEGLGVLPWSPLSGGFLSGKYTRENQSPEDARRTDFDFPPVDERGFDAVDALREIAENKNASVAQVALAWLLHQPGVTSVILGANKTSQLEDNLGATEIQLSDEELQRLSATTEPPRLYPQWMLDFQATSI